MVNPYGKYTDRQKKLKLETLVRNFLLLRRNYIKFGTHFSWNIGYLWSTNWECTKTGNKISLAVINSPPDPKSSVSCMAASSCNGGSYSPSHRPCKGLDCNLVEISPFLFKCIMQLIPCLHVILGIHPTPLLIPEMFNGRKIRRICWPREDCKLLLSYKGRTTSCSISRCVVVLEGVQVCMCLE